jgi:hypothetical protein
MKQRRGKGGERNDAQKQKGGAGIDEAVERVRRVDRGIGDGGAGGGISMCKGGKVG